MPVHVEPTVIAPESAIGDLPVNRLEHPFRRATHIVAWFSALFADAEERGNVAEGESESLRVSNECETLYDALMSRRNAGPVHARRHRVRLHAALFGRADAADLGLEGHQQSPKTS
jgi:hypothetical protein